MLPNLHALHVIDPGATSSFSSGSVRIRPLAGLLALPNLQELCLDKCLEDGTELKLDIGAHSVAHHICERDSCQIGNLVSMCTESRSYEIGHHGTLGLDLSYLAGCENKLEHLAIDIDKLAPILLTRYTIKKLDITANGIETTRPGTEAASPLLVHELQPPENFLAKVLPDSIEHIYFGVNDGETDFWQVQILALLKVANQSFRSLQVIEVR